ncbi:MAG TPA: SDR family oxidoreductase [Gemmatimonadales bacterium]|nr:SDR family oxidoreductase [Gemmatimonadales bacterium]
MTGGPLTGALAVVTGASRGIGLAVAQALRGAGARVVRLARSLPDGGGDSDTTLRCDLGDPASVERAAARILAAFGVPDVVVNNAGTFFVKPLVETTPEEFREGLAVNLTGPFLVVRSMVPGMIERGRGHVVSIGSVSDRVAYAGSGAYTAAKFGLRGLHEVLRAELAGTGVRATLVSPGPVDTPLWDPVDPDTRPGFTPRRDMMRPEDVAAAVLFAVTQPARVEVTEIRLMPAAR